MSAAIRPRPTLSLYERAQNLAAIDARIAWWHETHPEALGVTPDALSQEFEAALVAFQSKGEGYASYIRYTDTAVLNCQREIERLQELSGKLAARAARRRAELQAWMEERGVEEIPSDLFEKIALELNPPHAVIADGLQPADVPQRFQRVTPPKPAVLDFDKKAILAAARAGEALPKGLSVAQTTKLVIR